jgi:hypothetical protein
MTGAELITAERERQITEEGWTAEHDDEHECGELSLLAALYATPILLYIVNVYEGKITWDDPYGWTGWSKEWDKRKRSIMDNIIPNGVLPNKERIRNLVKAGALIAAEIDRLQRLRK